MHMTLGRKALAGSALIAALGTACSSSSAHSDDDAATPHDDAGRHDAGRADAASHDATAAHDGAHRSRDAGEDSAKPDAFHKPDTGVDAKKDATPSHEGGPADAGKDAHVVIHDAGVDAYVAPFLDAGPGCDYAGAFGAMGEPTDLKCSGLYSDWATKTIASNVRPYKPGLQLWSDGAKKNRWIALPAGTKIDTSDMDEWTFPIGTRIWKEFNLPSSEADGGVVRIETRMITKIGATNVDNPAASWYLTTYRWTADGETDAKELQDGEPDANGHGYEVPSQAECTSCHWGRNDIVMGFEAVSLAAPDAGGFTMADLIDAGLLTNPPDPSTLAIPGDPTAAAALGYLHVNCGVACHNEGVNAAAGNTSFQMRLDVADLHSVETTETYATGWNMTTDTLQIPNEETSYRIASCSTAESAAYFFADHRNSVDGYFGPQMPAIDTHVVDTAGLAQLVAWINEHCDGGTGAGQ